MAEPELQWAERSYRLSGSDDRQVVENPCVSSDFNDVISAGLEASVGIVEGQEGAQC